MGATATTFADIKKFNRTDGFRSGVEDYTPSALIKSVVDEETLDANELPILPSDLRNQNQVKQSDYSQSLSPKSSMKSHNLVMG